MFFRPDCDIIKLLKDRGTIMNLELKPLSKKDEKRAIEFAIKGMHLDIYFNDNFSLMLYAKYFWYLESGKATQSIAAYADGKFVGILIASFKGEKSLGKPFLKNLYVKFFEFVSDLFFRNSAGAYGRANEEMYAEFTKNNTPDGELVFLAADPEFQGRGIGTALLNELAERERGKRIFLYTDDKCSYEFYEKRGFDRSCERDILMEINGRRIPLNCFLYSKRI